MARLARVVVKGVPHHVTQRGNARRFMLNTDADRAVYLDLLRHYSRLHSLSVLGYCLMSNHVHLVTIPAKSESLAAALKETHGRYASYWNAKHTSSGHLWQGRFYSCPLDDVHVWRALRYTELNPVRAGLVETAEVYGWSSAAAHCGRALPDPILELDLWTKHWGEKEWRRYLCEQDAAMDADAIRRSTHTGRPLGSAEFVGRLESTTGRELSPRKGKRKPAPTAEVRQSVLEFERWRPVGNFPSVPGFPPVFRDYIYDGPHSNTLLDAAKFPSEAEEAPPTVKTVGDWFNASEFRQALSQYNGAAVWLRLDDWSTWLRGTFSPYITTIDPPSQSGTLNSYGMGTLLHEVLHKQQVGGFTHIDMANALGINLPSDGQIHNQLSDFIGQQCFSTH